VDLVESLGHRATGHPSADAFLQVGDLACDCVITDIQMPGLSGIDLKRRLVELGHTVPVIMVTARKDPALLQRAREADPACLLQKPFTAEALIDCLQSALGT
jgi:FixJ family two-component response regulator